MLRDTGDNGGHAQQTARSVLGEPLEICSIKPMTGFYRDGCCDTGQEDVGSHTVCAVMTAAFLDFSKSRGNDPRAQRTYIKLRFHTFNTSAQILRVWHMPLLKVLKLFGSARRPLNAACH